MPKIKLPLISERLPTREDADGDSEVYLYDIDHQKLALIEFRCIGVNDLWMPTDVFEGVVEVFNG